MAAALPWFIPAGAHFYLGRPLTGVLLCLYMLFGFVHMCGNHPEIGVMYFVGAILADLILAQLTFPREQAPMSKWRQLVIGALVGGAITGGAYAYESSANSADASKVPDIALMKANESSGVEGDTEFIRLAPILIPPTPLPEVPNR